MTAPTTAATQEELAAKLDKAATWFDSDDQITFIAKDAAHVIRAQKLHTDRVDAKLVEQERQIERLTKERDRMREALEDIDRWARAACLRSGAYATNSDAMTNDQADFYNIAERAGAALSAKEATDER